MYRCVNRMSAVARALRELVNETSSEVIILSDDDEESVDVSEKRKEGATPLAASSSGGCANTTPTRGKGVSTLIYDLTQSESALQTFQRLVEEIVDVEALAGGAKDRSMFGSKWI